MALDADHIPINVGREPLFASEGEAACYFYVSRSAIERIAANGPEWKFYDAKLVKQALANPLAVFEGLNRPDYNDGYCYVAKPSLDQWQSAEGLLVAEKAKFLFLVYVKKRHGLVVFDWAWRKEDTDNAGHPEGWQRDFAKGKIWPPPITS